MVESRDGGVYRRNRRHLRDTRADIPVENDDIDPTTRNNQEETIDPSTTPDLNRTDKDSDKCSRSEPVLRPHREIQKPIRYRDNNFVYE